jgi:hypothetical protein
VYSSNQTWVSVWPVTALKSSVFWDITLCSRLKIMRRFGRTCRLHFQGRKISQERKQHEAGGKKRESELHATCPILVPCFVYSSIIIMQAKCSSETSLNFNGIHGFISQKTEHFIIITVRTSDLQLLFCRCGNSSLTTGRVCSLSDCTANYTWCNYLQCCMYTL